MVWVNPMFIIPSIHCLIFGIFQFNNNLKVVDCTKVDIIQAYFLVVKSNLTHVYASKAPIYLLILGSMSTTSSVNYSDPS